MPDRRRRGTGRRTTREGSFGAATTRDGKSRDHGTLPRTQAGTTPQLLLLTLLGDYWKDRTEHLPSAALVELLDEFDITEGSARAALNRLVKRRLLLSSKCGRNTFYGVDPVALHLLQEALDRIVAFGADAERSWDGRWALIAFSIPEPHRRLRAAVRTNLRWLGFAALYDGLWCSPWDHENAALLKLEELGVCSLTVMRAEIDAASPVQPLSAWDLGGLRDQYRQFEERFSPVLEDARRGALTATEALVHRTMVMDSWRNFVDVEPDFPAGLLPADWPRTRMRALFFELYDTLAPIAQARFQQLVAKYSPELADLVTRISVGEREEDPVRRVPSSVPIPRDEAAGPATPRRPINRAAV